MSDDFCAHFCGDFIFYSIINLVDYVAFSKRDAIIRHGRRLQRILRIPERMRIFSEHDPGIHDEDIRTGAQVLLWSTFWIAALMTLGVRQFSKNALQGVGVMCLGIVPPVVAMGIFWFRMACEYRRRSRERIPCLEDGGVVRWRKPDKQTPRTSSKDGASKEKEEGPGQPAPREWKPMYVFLPY